MSAFNFNKDVHLSNSDINVGNKDIMPLDTRVKHEYDNLESFSCHSGLRAEIQRGDNLMPKAFQFDQSGRSMVEMLGTLAVMGVLSIGGIMGYSYAVDKYHANQIMNDVNLRGIDLIAQASRGGDFSLAEWPTKTSSDLDIGLEVDEATNTTEGGIYVNGVEKDICEIIADDLLPEEVELVIDGESYVSGACGETNKMVFYYDAVAEALGGGKEPECNGVLIDGVCMDCPANTTPTTDGTQCLCPDGGPWDFDTNDCLTSCKEVFNDAFDIGGIIGGVRVGETMVVFNGVPPDGSETTVSFIKDLNAPYCDLKIEAGQSIIFDLNDHEINVRHISVEGVITVSNWGEEATFNASKMTLSGGSFSMSGMSGWLMTVNHIDSVASHINISDGQIKSNQMTFSDDSSFSIGGKVDASNITLSGASNLNIQGGYIQAQNITSNESSVNFGGGEIDVDNITVSDVEMGINGGVLTIDKLRATGSSEISIYGGMGTLGEVGCSDSAVVYLYDTGELNISNMSCSNVEDYR